MSNENMADLVTANANAIRIAAILQLTPQEEPVSGIIGDIYKALDNSIYLCIVAGTPATWQKMTE